MSKKGFVATIVLAALLFGGAYQNCMAEKKKNSQKPEDCQGTTLMPVDESKSTNDASFKEFIDKLREAVKNSDAQFVKDHLHPNIIITYPQYDKTGKEVEKSVSGSDRFMSKWGLDPEKKDSSNSFWKTMKTILDLGGSFKNKETYVAPYVHSAWLETCMPVGYGAIVKENVIVREASKSDAKEIGKLSYVIVKADYSKSTENWVQIIIPNGKDKDKGKTGYVEAESIRSYYDYSVQFVKEGEKWLITIFAEFPKTSKGIPDPPPYIEIERSRPF